MMRPHKAVIVFLSLFIWFAQLSKTVAQITYPDTQLPTDTPRLFAKGILSDGLSNRDFAISPEGDEIFFTLQQPGFALSTILHITKQGNTWNKPEVAPFSGQYRDLEAAFSPNGKYIYFSSDRPLNENGVKKDFDIWRVKRLRDGKWAEPENLGPNVNSDKDEFYPCITKSGNLYFTAELTGGKGKEDIVVCKWTGSGYAKPVSLPGDINMKGEQFNAFVDPDEQFILFSAFGRADDIGGGDLYMSCVDQRGIWQPVRHLPPPINSTGLDYCPYVTADKQYLIFTSSRLSKEFEDGKPKTYQQMKEMLTSTGNGLDDIYWVKFNPKW